MIGSRHCVQTAAAVLAVAAATSLLTAAGIVAAAPGENADSVSKITVAHWNVENLFDAVDDPANKGDDEFTPESWRKWTPERYREKLDHLAGVLAEIKADIVCLVEVENRRVLNDLRAVLRDKHGIDYAVVIHRDSPDLRGIDVSLLSRFPTDTVEWFAPLPFRREVVVARFALGGQPLTIVANHWKSHYGDKGEADDLRAGEASFVGDLVVTRLKNEPVSAIMVVGDLNDDFDSPVVCEALGSSTNLSLAGAAPDRTLFNLHAGLAPDKRGTIYYVAGQKWNSFDSMHVSRAMLDPAVQPAGWKVEQDGYEVFSRPYMLKDGLPIPYRITSQPETKRRIYLTGYSDHLPVRVTLRRRAP